MSTTLREDSVLASYTPDVAAEIDGDHTDLIEQFAEIAKGWHGLPPSTRLGFEKAVVAIFIKGLEGGLLKAAMEEGRAEAFSLAAVAVFKVIDMITSHDNPKMVAACFKFAIGTEPRSMTEVGVEFGVERATISKWARRCVEVLDLVPGRGMRRREAVEAYRESARRVWARRFEEQKAELAPI